MKKQHRLLREAIAIAALGLALPVGAADENADEKEAKTRVLDKIMVIGNPANIEKIPGSAQVITKEDIRQQNYDDINRTLRKVPGVYVREEDGFGLFPSISLRGVDTTRNSKITVMEDGVMMSPAPYTAPAAYYSPTAGRMSGVEVLKGSSQIKYGPHTTGGVINYLSTPIPTKEKAYLKSTLGSFNEQRTHAYAGNTFDTTIGQVGVLVEGYRRQSDGFKKIDETDGFRGGDETGFDKTDAIIKLSWEPNSDMYQRLELKYGTSKLDADETYLGLSQADFNADPTRRYAASRFDNIKSEQEQLSLRWSISPTDNIDVITTLYHTGFKRNWYKLNKVNEEKPSTFIEAAPGLSQNCMKGTAACELKIKANNRKYKTQGIETAGYFRFGSGNVQHEVMAGLRLHQDSIRRFQWEDKYTQAANGAITDMTPGVKGDAGNRFQETKALALFIQDTIEVGALTVVPGIRYEQLDQISKDDDNGVPISVQSADGPKGRDGENRFNVSAYGIGVAYQFTKQLTAFGGLHTGYSTPSPRGTSGGLDPETSTAFEIGTRYTNAPQAFAIESTFFYTAFEDLIVTDNVGGTGNGEDGNFGKVDTLGVELAIQYDAGLANNWGLSNPSYLSATYTNAEQKSDSVSEDAESIFSFGAVGNAVPYIPEFTLSLGTGIENKKWGAFIAGNYVSETFTSANNVENQLNGEGNPDARYGKTDSYFTADVSAFYRMTETVKLFGGVQNLFDKEYVVSRQPDGARGGLPQFVYAGIEMEL